MAGLRPLAVLAVLPHALLERLFDDSRLGATPAPPNDPALLQAFARSMRKLREAAGEPSIRELARAAGYSDTTVRHVLQGRLQQSRRVVQAVAAALGADAEEWGRRWEELDLRLHPPRPKRCAVEGRPNSPRGPWCTTHRRHQELYGDPTAGRFSPKTHPAICSVEGCGRPYRARGLCKLHYDHHLAANAADRAEARR